MLEKEVGERGYWASTVAVTAEVDEYAPSLIQSVDQAKGRVLFEGSRILRVADQLRAQTIRMVILNELAALSRWESAFRQ